MTPLFGLQTLPTEPQRLPFLRIAGDFTPSKGEVRCLGDGRAKLFFGSEVAGVYPSPALASDALAHFQRIGLCS